MQPRNKPLIPHVALDGTVGELESYRERTTNDQIIPFLMESLSSDLDFSTDWMVELEDIYKSDKKELKQQLIGHSNIIVGSARCGKLGYIFYRKEQEAKDNIKMILIDCLYHTTPYSFICSLVEQLGEYLEKSTTRRTKKKDRDEQGKLDTEVLSKSIAIDNDINLKYLDNHILARPDLKFIITIRNCDLLVQKKKQLILYNLLEWIKGDVQGQVGFALLTRRLDFLEKLEKRIKSRMNYKMIFLTGPKDEKVVKEALVKRFQYALASTEDHELILPGKKIIGFFQKSTALESLIKQEQTFRSPKQIQFFLHIFKLILGMHFIDREKTVMPRDQKQFDIIISHGYEQAKKHLYPYAERQKLILQNMNYPEFITMCIIRRMLIHDKSRICLKEIKKQLALFKQASYTSSGNSFDFPLKCFERAIKNLKKIRVLDLNNEKDIDNAEIISLMSPDQIKEAIGQRDDLPMNVKSLLD